MPERHQARRLETSGSEGSGLAVPGRLQPPPPGQSARAAITPKEVAMRQSFIAAAAVLFSAAALAQQPPKFFVDSYPTHALKSALEARAVLEGKDAKLDGKTRELIALAVSAQIPCQYCVYAHTRNARAKGASEAEIREAVATAATTRQWSTVLNGMAISFADFKAEVDSR